MRPYFQASCTINLGTFGQSAGGYVIAVQLEDFSTSDTAFGNPLSSVPVQLGVFLFNASTAPCDQPPVFIAPTPSQNQTIQMVDDNQSFNIYARTKDPYTV